MNISMWQRALTGIPNVSKEEWVDLAVISAALAGLFAWREGDFRFTLTFGSQMVYFESIGLHSGADSIQLDAQCS